MDTISRENNSVLPLAGVVVGGLAIILSAVALVKLSSLKTELTQVKDDHAARIASVESQAASAAATAEQTKGLATRIQSDTNTAFQQVAEQLGTIRGEITKLQEAPKAAAKTGGKAGAAKKTAGEGEYLIKKGDVPSKIAKTLGVDVATLKAANPGVNWSKLKPGDIIKKPTK